jgi:cysteine synthase A
MQGWGPDFIPKLTADAVELGLIDELLPISGGDAMQCTRDLATREGIFTGVTGGATLAGGLAVCRTAPPGSTILCMLPDTGERYLSTPLFQEIPESMTDEELDISRSTPTARFDQPAPPPPPAPSEPEPATAVTEEARTFVRHAIGNPDQPVVLFALEWCEFCWSIRKLFARCRIEYRAVDLDSVPYQRDNQGVAIRAALTEHTGCKTIPQVFVGGEFLGGATEVFDAWAHGRLQALLTRHGVAFDAAAVKDPYRFLPAWLQPR